MRTYITAAACLAVAGVAVTAQVREASLKRDTAKVYAPRVTSLLGATVSLREGGALGKVSDLTYGDTGRLDYYIVRQGDDFWAVPWRVVDRGADGALTINTTVTRERMRGVLFREAAWPDFASAGWRRLASDVWGAEPAERPLDSPATTTRTTNGSTNTDPRSRTDPGLPGGTGDTRDRRPVKDR